VQLLTAPLANTIALAAWTIGIILGMVVALLALRSALTSEERSSRWSRMFSGINARYLFGFLFIGWALFFGVVLQLVPHEGAGTPYGVLGFVALISGSFVTFAFLWSVIRE
jgi:hypothetical protein